MTAHRVDPQSSVVPAATVALLRDGGGGMQVLMVRRSKGLAFAPDLWAFPGGRIETVDREGSPDEATSARCAAVRESREEVGLQIDAGALAWIAHWTGPVRAARRFATWFFICPSPSGVIRVDGGEIREAAWMAPTHALSTREAGGMKLAPPTWMTLHLLEGFPDVTSAMRYAWDSAPAIYESVMHGTDETPVAVWSGDVAYESGDLDCPGPRHRLIMPAVGWRLERDDIG